MKPTPEAIAEAKRQPNGYVYAIEGDFGDAAVPPQAIEGAWKVDANGNIVGEFISNANYVPGFQAKTNPPSRGRMVGMGHIEIRPFNWSTDWPYLVVEIGVIAMLIVLAIAAFRRRK